MSESGWGTGPGSVRRGRALPGCFDAEGLGSLSVAGLVDVNLVAARAESREFAVRLAAISELYERRYARRIAEQEALELAPVSEQAEQVFSGERQFRFTDEWHTLVADVGASCRVNPGVAASLIDLAVALRNRLPQCFGLVHSGVLTAQQVRLLVSRCEAMVDERLCLIFDARVAERLSRDLSAVWTLGELRSFADRIVLRLDPDAVKRRRKKALEDRGIWFFPSAEGMAALTASLSAEDGVFLADRLDQIADTVCKRDPRRKPARRVDGLIALVDGYATLGCQCDDEGCELWERVIAHPTDARRVVVITAIANSSTLAGDDDEPATVVGHGPISADHLRDLADGDDAVVRDFGTPTSPTTEQPEHPEAPEHEHETCSAASDDEHAEQIHAEQGDAEQSDTEQSEFEECGGEPATDDDRTGLDPGDAGTGDTAHQDQATTGGDPPDDETPPPANPATAPPATAPAAPTPATAPPATAPAATAPAGAATPAAAAPGAAGRAARDYWVRARLSTGYRPSADLTRFIQMEYLNCTFPGCATRVTACELDHVQEYNHAHPAQGGSTTADNLAPLCRVHHLVKTEQDWLSERLPDGQFEWTAPTGHRYRTAATRGSHAFPGLAHIQWVGGPIDPAETAPKTTPGTTADTPTADTTPETAAAAGSRTPGPPLSRAEIKNRRRQALRRRHARERRKTAKPSAHAGLPEWDGPPPF